jgi:hypothetical protein
MADQPIPPNSPSPAGPAHTAQRQLHPGGGRRLRRTYLLYLISSIVVVLLILSFALFATVLASGEGGAVTLLTGTVAITISSVCLIVALLRGRAAVHDDWVSIPAATRSQRAARVGSLLGWIGALAVAATGVIQHYQQVDTALLQGIVLGGATLIPAVGNDSANRMARQITA